MIVRVSRTIFVCMKFLNHDSPDFWIAMIYDPIIKSGPLNPRFLQNYYSFITYIKIFILRFDLNLSQC